jgi:hypothetical protein
VCSLCSRVCVLSLPHPHHVWAVKAKAIPAKLAQSRACNMSDQFAASAQVPPDSEIMRDQDGSKRKIKLAPSTAHHAQYDRTSLAAQTPNTYALYSQPLLPATSAGDAVSTLRPIASAASMSSVPASLQAHADLQDRKSTGFLPKLLALLDDPESQHLAKWSDVCYFHTFCY